MLSRLLAPMGLASAGLILWLLFLHDTAAAQPKEQDYSRQPYTHHVTYEPTSSTLTYGDRDSLLHEKTPLLSDETYRAFVQSMPIVCVDVLLQRGDGRLLLVKRHAEPVRGLYWVPGGRLLRGETFAAAGVRKVRSEIGISSCFRNVLGTFNTLFEQSAWGGSTQTINILVHATTSDPVATSGLPICGDQRGRCADGSHSRYKWILPQEAHAEDTYIRTAVARLRAADPDGRLADAPCDARESVIASGAAPHAALDAGSQRGEGHTATGVRAAAQPVGGGEAGARGAAETRSGGASDGPTLEEYRTTTTPRRKRSAAAGGLKGLRRRRRRRGRAGGGGEAEQGRGREEEEELEETRDPDPGGL